MRKEDAKKFYSKYITKNFYLRNLYFENKTLNNIGILKYVIK